MSFKVRESVIVWRTSLTCNGGACVRVATQDRMILIGDSKTPNGPVLTYTAREWNDFLTGAKNGDFDDLIA